MNLNDTLNIIENRINEYIIEANRIADSDPKLCEELNIKTLALFDVKNEIKEEDAKEKNTEKYISLNNICSLVTNEIKKYTKQAVEVKEIDYGLYKRYLVKISALCNFFEVIRKSIRNENIT